MTVYLRHPAYPRWCRLATVGAISHRTACDAAIPADTAVLLHPDPPIPDRCTACEPLVDAVEAWDQWAAANLKAEGPT